MRKGVQKQKKKDAFKENGNAPNHNEVQDVYGCHT